MIDPRLTRVQDALRVWSHNTPRSSARITIAAAWNVEAPVGGPVDEDEQVAIHYTVEVRLPYYAGSDGVAAFRGTERCDGTGTLQQATARAFARARDAWQREHDAAVVSPLHDDARNERYESARTIIAAQRVALDALCAKVDAIFEPPPSESR